MVRSLSRHRHLKTTLDHYAESTLPQLAKAVEKLPALAYACAVGAPRLRRMAQTSTTTAAQPKTKTPWQQQLARAFQSDFR
jgi:hypothetical protein